MPWIRSAAACGLAVVTAACAPALDWREVRPEGADLTLLMPCRPTRQARSVSLAGRNVALVLHACSAGDQTWGLAFADTGDPSQVGPALEALRKAAAANLGVADGDVRAFEPRGATPNPAALRVRLAGRLPDGAGVAEEAAFFTRGTAVYQATVLGPNVPPEIAAIFFDSVKLGS